MDGNNSTRQVIITENIIWPNGLTVDYEARRFGVKVFNCDLFSFVLVI